MDTITQLGFIGLGNIGKPMAECLLKAFPHLKVYDINLKAMKDLESQGANIASSSSDFTDCQLLSLCVRHDQDVEYPLYKDKLLEKLPSGSAIAIHSTVTRDNILRWAEDAKTKNITLIDAPISGGADGAKNGTLVYMLGVDCDDIFQQFKAIYEKAASAVIHAGPIGSGIILKLANNLMTYSAFTAASEALELAKSGDLSLDLIQQVGEINGVYTPQMHRFISHREALAPACSPEEMQIFFGPFADLAEKDLDHALALAEQNGLKLEASEAVRGKIKSVFLKQD
jgi:3-hydroxyisobutyrate dehydrogenase-like beta-hydroxyacid dehydrogenase